MKRPCLILSSTLLAILVALNIFRPIGLAPPYFWHTPSLYDALLFFWLPITLSCFVVSFIIKQVRYRKVKEPTQPRRIWLFYAILFVTWYMSPQLIDTHQYPTNVYNCLFIESNNIRWQYGYSCQNILPNWEVRFRWDGVSTLVWDVQVCEGYDCFEE